MTSEVLVLGKGFISDHLPYQKFTGRLPIDDGLTFVERVLDKHQPKVVINCIGKTGRPNVDWCEKNREETYLANVVLPSILAAKCAAWGVHFIHIGSGCIFFGESPNSKEELVKRYLALGGNKEDNSFNVTNVIDTGWKESDFANPKSFYSKTKYACDLTIGEMPNVSVLRIRMPVSTKNEERNFINKVRNYSHVIDIPNSMTIVDDLVRCVDWFATTKTPGIFNVVNPEPITAAQVMREFQKYKPEHKFEVIDETELDRITIAKRSNCILNGDKLRDAGFTMTPSKEALEACMVSYIKNI